MLDPKSTALLIIDMQNGFCHPESQMGRNVGVNPQQTIIPQIEKLVDFCRSKNIFVFWSQQVHIEGDKTRSNRCLKTHAQKQNFLPCLENTFEVDFYKPAKSFMQDQDEVIKKHRASVFFDTNFSSQLRIRGIDTLIIAGCNTEFCVAHTVRDAYARDFDILIVRDCVAGINQDFHENMLKIMNAYLGEVIDLQQIETYFR